MSVDTNNTELQNGADQAAGAEQRDDERQQAEAAAAQEVLQRMQDTAAEDETRRAHEEADAKRKAEWEQKQREKAEAEQAAWENAVAMGDDEVMMASMKRVGDDAERLTRRNIPSEDPAKRGCAAARGRLFFLFGISLDSYGYVLCITRI